MCEESVARSFLCRGLRFCVFRFFQDGLTGSAWGDWANYTASPLRAFENELGVQDPVGFFAPAGFTADGSVENFKRRRQTELKHGRISMLATMGYITPEPLGHDIAPKALSVGQAVFLQFHCTC